MLKLNHLVPLSLLLVVAVLFGALGGVDAKQNPPPVPPNTSLVKPDVDGIMTFYVDENDPSCENQGFEKVSFVGSCGKVDVNVDICFEWRKSGSPALEETDLFEKKTFGQIIEIDQQPLVGLLQECYEDFSVDVFLLQFQKVKKFTELVPDETYTADVRLKRLIANP